MDAIKGAKPIINAVKQAFDLFERMELPIKERECVLEYDAAMTLINAFEQAAKEREANQYRWRTPKDEPPDVPVFYAVSKFDPNVRVYRKNDKDPHYTTEWVNIRDDILYWMPPPEPPKGVH